MPVSKNDCTMRIFILAVCLSLLTIANAYSQEDTVVIEVGLPVSLPVYSEKAGSFPAISRSESFRSGFANRLPAGLIPVPTTLLPLAKNTLRNDYSLGIPGVTLFGDRYSDAFFGYDRIGVNYGLDFSENFGIDLMPFVTDAYYGGLQPDRNPALSIRATIRIRLVDFMTLYGVGQVSSAANPNLGNDMLFGGGTYYGGFLEVRVTDNLQLIGGVRRYYMQGKWKTTYQVGPRFVIRKPRTPIDAH